MEQGSRYGPPIERKTDGTLYEMTPVQQRQAAKIIQKYCSNYDRGNCLLLEDGDERVCPQQISYAVWCRWFRNALLPMFPELEAEIFKDIALRRCVKCGTRFVPHSNRSKYCPVCAAAVRRAGDRERKRKKRHAVRI
ncbi:MAG: cysteine-rich VLP domain-containing protein [Lachnospiraceae bacterium]|nr:cysteine-rich VLP domain-containing protein [Lachnospiraceae bacterium]